MKINIRGRFSADDPVTYSKNEYGKFTEVASPGVYNNPPIGAILFWGVNRWSSQGHFAISIGNGKAVSTPAFPYADGNPNDPKVFRMNLSQRLPAANEYNYFGYILPIQASTTSPTTTSSGSKATPPSRSVPITSGSLSIQNNYNPQQTAPSPSIQIGWSQAYPGWISMDLRNVSPGTYNYTCNFASGGDTTFTLTVTPDPQNFENSKTCYDLESGDQVWVTILGVSSNTLTVP